MANDSILIQVQLGSPTKANINAVTRQIQSALSNVSANVQIQNGRQAAQQLQTIKNKTDSATKSMNSFGEAIGLSGRRFLAFTSAVAVLGRLTSALSQATREAIKFEREFVKLAQVFDTDVKSLGRLQNSMSEVAQEFGLSATVIAKTSVVLAQSGLTARQTEQAMKTLAKTTLAATFDSIASSTEGAVAIMNQFGTEASKLETQLGAINAVSKKFAVESGDIIEAVRRAGGAFKAAGGNLNDFIALFTAVRSTTRESAETIATGFRTIFARLQRPKTIEFFRQLNIELTDGRGNFIGAFEAIRRLSNGLEQAGIKAGSIKFASVVEQLGGIRQVSRVIPLLQQFAKAERARQTAVAGGGSLDADAAKAQETLSQAFARTTENFRALIREISQTATFQAIVKIALDLANSFIEVARTLKPLIPLIAALGAVKLGGIFSSALRKGFGGAGGTGGLGQGFKRGGPVPGTGSGDTVPAMLEPGEFVIRKSAVQAFGAENLAGINKYAGGNIVRKQLNRTLQGRIKTQKLSYDGLNNPDINLSNSAKGSIRGYLTETVVNNAIGYKDSDDKFPDLKDLNERQKRKLGLLGKNIPKAIRHAEVKHTEKNIDANKFKGKYNDKNTAVVYGFNKGGSVGTDTVPALLTPGEFVINKESAKSFGYGNLGKINKYAKGGPVQKFANGGTAGGGAFGGLGKFEAALFIIPSLLSSFAESLGGADSQLAQFTQEFGKSFIAITAIKEGTKAVTKSLFNIGQKKDPIEEKSEAAAQSIESSGGEISSSVSSSGKKVAISLETLANAIRGIQDKLKGVRGAVKEEKEARRKLDFVKGQQQQFPGAFPQRFVDAAEKELAEATKKLAKYRSLSGAKARLLGESGFKNQKELNDAVKKEAKEANRRAQAADFLKTKLKESRLKTIKAEGGTLKDAPRSRPFLKSLRQTGSLNQAFGKLAKVAGKVGGPLGKVAAGLFAVINGLGKLAIVITAGVSAAFQVAANNAQKASEEAIKEGNVQEAQRQALRSAENEKAAKDLTVATGFLSGILGDGIGGFLAVILSATGALGPIFDTLKRIFNGLIKGVVNFLDFFGIVDPDIKKEIFSGLIDPEVERRLRGFSAALQAATNNLKKQSEIITQQIEQSKIRLQNISDEEDRNKLLKRTFSDLTSQVSKTARDRRVDGVNITGGPEQIKILQELKAQGSADRRLQRELAIEQNKQREKINKELIEGGFVGELPPLVDVPIFRELPVGAEEAFDGMITAAKEATEKLKGLNEQQLAYLGFIKTQAQTTQELSTIMGLAAGQTLKFIKTKEGEIVLSGQTIVASTPLTELYNNLVIELGDEELARSTLTAVLSDEVQLRKALNQDLANQRKAFSSLLERFTFGTLEQRAGIGRNISGARQLVDAGFDANKLGEKQRGEVLSFLKSVPGATIGGVRSEDIVINSILKQFEGQLGGTVLGDDEEGIRKALKDQLFPEYAQLEELRKGNDLLADLKKIAQDDVDPEVKAKEDRAFDKIKQARLQVTGDTKIQADNVIVSLKQKASEDAQAYSNLLESTNELNKGGVVYAAGGTLVNFQPKGTDTVPAMLTPGEFVINAQSASRLGLGTLTALNNYAKGGPVKYFNQAGGVKPLTPKELEELEKENKRLRAESVNKFQSSVNESLGGIREGDPRSRLLYGGQYAGTRREIFNSRRRLSQRNIAAYEGMGRGKDNTSPTLDESLARAKERVRPIQHSTGTRSREDSFSAGGGNFGKVRIGNRLVNRFGPTQKAPDSVRVAGRFGPLSQQEEKDFQDAKTASAKRARSITSEFGGAGAVIGEDGSFQGFMDGMSSSDPTATAEQLRSAYRQKQFKRAVATGGSYAYQGGRSAGFERRRQQALNRSGARKFGIQNRKDAFAAEVARVKAANPKLSDKRARGVASRQIAKARKTVESLPSTLSSMAAMATDVFNSFTTEANVQAAGIGQTPTVNITDQAGLDQVARNQEISLGTPQVEDFQQETKDLFQNLVIPRPAPPPLAEPIPRPEYSPTPPQTSILQELNPPKRQSPLSPAAPPLPEPRVAPVPMPDPFKNLKGFNKGGLVGAPQYLNRGGMAGGGGMDTSGLASFANSFGSSVSELVGSAITLEVAPMGVNINLNGAELLAQLPQMVNTMVVNQIQSELAKFEQTKDFNNTPGAYASSILA